MVRGESDERTDVAEGRFELHLLRAAERGGTEFASVVPVAQSLPRAEILRDTEGACALREDIRALRKAHGRRGQTFERSCRAQVAAVEMEDPRHLAHRTERMVLQQSDVFVWTWGSITHRFFEDAGEVVSYA